MSLGDHVRVARTFLEAFKSGELSSGEPGSSGETDPNEQIVKNEELAQLQRDLKVSFLKSLFQHRPMMFLLGIPI